MRSGSVPAGTDGNDIQNAILDVARAIERYQDHTKKSPEGGPGVSVSFFQMLYEVLIGQERGPRFGSFVALYGIDETRALIKRRWLANWRECQGREWKSSASCGAFSLYERN